MGSKKRKILIIGIDSMVGKILKLNLESCGFEVYGTSRRIYAEQNLYFLDLNSHEFELPPNFFDFAIFCAGETSVKKCEEYYNETRKINVENTIQLISYLTNRGVFIVFISSNKVFDGSQPFCTPEHLTNPITNYGRFKLEVEDYLIAKRVPSSILRLTKVLSPNSGVLEEWHHCLAKNIAINAYIDVLVSPIGLPQVAEAVFSIISSEKMGVFHLGGKFETSYFELAKQYFKNNSEALQLINPVSSNLSRKGKHNSLSTYLP